MVGIDSTFTHADGTVFAVTTYGDRSGDVIEPLLEVGHNRSGPDRLLLLGRSAVVHSIAIGGLGRRIESRAAAHRGWHERTDGE